MKHVGTLLFAAICSAPVAGQFNETGGHTGFEVADGGVLDDPAAAFAAEVEAALSGHPRVEALRALVDRWSANDPEAAARAVESLAKSGDGALLREGLGEIAGRRWAERDPDSAIGWALRLGGNGAWSGVLAGLAATDPERAIAVASTVQSRPGDEMVSLVIAEIASRDPAAAAEHWQRAGLTELGVYPGNRIARSWAARDPAAAERWALGLPGGAGRDSALMTIVAFGAHDSARAAALVNQIGDERMQGLRSSTRSFAASDPADCIEEGAWTSDTSVSVWRWGSSLERRPITPDSGSHSGSSSAWP